MANIIGAAGADVLIGGSADDVLSGGLGNDTLTGGGGRDQFVFGPAFGSVTITDFQSGQDQIVFNGVPPGEIKVTHGSVVGSDFAVHGVSYITIDGQPGLITVQDSYLSGTDLTVPDGASVALFGMDFGGSGTGQADVLFGGSAPTFIYGWDGDDRLYAGDRSSALLGGAGNDLLVGGAAGDILDGDSGGAPGDDILHGGGGDDQLISDGGDDTLDGGAGNDMAELGSGTHGIHVDLSLEGVAQDTGIGLMTLASIEWVLAGSPFDDVLDASGLATSVGLTVSGGGHDIAIGGSGDDGLTSFAGSSTLTGGAGRDFFQIINSGTGSPADHSLINFDTITDFQTGVDTLDFIGQRITIVDNAAGGAVVYADTDGDGTDDTKVVLTTGRIVGEDFSLLYGIRLVVVSSSADEQISGPIDNWAAYGGANIASYAAATAGVHVSLALQGQSQDTGGAGHDTLIHMSGLVGSAFGDVLTGDGSKNSLTGGGGADVFVFKPDGADDPFLWQTNHGTDTVTDFSIAQGDRLDLSAFQGFHTLLGVLAASHQAGSDTVIAAGSNQIVLQGVTMASLDASDFIFAPSALGVIGAAASNFNGDHYADLLFREPGSGQWGYAAFNGSGGYTWMFEGGSTASYGVAGKADFNGDGFVDILFRQSSGAWGYEAMGPSGPGTWHDMGGSTASYGEVRTGDFNGDGLADILFREASTGNWGYAAMTASGGYSWMFQGGSTATYSLAGTGDFNGDGISDVLFRENGTGNWGFAQMNSSGGYAWTFMGGSTASYSVVGTGDFNGDGISDILFRDNATGAWGYAAMHGSAYVWNPEGGSTASYSVVATGDYNGDGFVDIAFRNDITGDWGYEAMAAIGAGSWHPMGASTASYAAF